MKTLKATFRDSRDDVLDSVRYLKIKHSERSKAVISPKVDD
jgi:hypothetical protein